MGVVVNSDDFQSIDLLKDLETARIALNKKADDPLEWEINESSADDDFIMVTPRRSRNLLRDLIFLERNLPN
jgi:hypothetical protein